jgi:glycosyltransferase involved in cell wall biosynthesis
MVTTNIAGLERVAPPGMTIRCYPPTKIPNRWLRNLRLFWSARRSDHLVINFEVRDVAFFAVLFLLLPRRRCRLTTLDLFVGEPRERDLRFIRWSIRSVDRLLVYFRDTRHFGKLLDAPASKFQYVPFKINGFERIRSIRPSEDGYIFCGGRSRRDFRTLFEAVKVLPCPVKVVTCAEAELNRHGSSMTGLDIPGNVEIIRRDADEAFFLDCMARATLVVLPTVKDNLTQAGIGVYLQAMALRKCVIISAGLGVSDVLTDQAVIVRPGDAAELRTAIMSVWSDPSLRAAYAERAYRYATPLGGEDELYRSILAALPQPTSRR